MKKVIQTRFITSLNEYQNNAAIEDGERTVTYSLLTRRAAALSRWLVETGVPEHTLIGIYTSDLVDLVVGISGILCGRCVFVPLDPQLPVNRIKIMVRHSGIRLILADGKGREALGTILMDNGEPVAIEIIEAVITGHASLNELKHREAQPHDPVYVYFTSGTSGVPRAVLGQNKSLHHLVCWEIETLDIVPGTRVSQLAAPGFDAFLRDMFVPLCNGGTVCAPGYPTGVPDGQELVHWLDSRSLQAVHCVPAIFRLILSGIMDGDLKEKNDKERFGSLNYLLMAGESLDFYYTQAWFNIFGTRVQLINCYGTTETTMFKTYFFLSPPDDSDSGVILGKIPAGRPVKGARIVIMDCHMNVCARGHYGEIYIRTPYASLGYCNSPTLTHEYFLPNPATGNARDIFHKTGDTGRLMPDGCLEVKGRIDRQVNIRGLRIEPGDIECRLLAHPRVREAVIVPRSLLPHRLDEKELCAYVILTGGDLNTDNLKDYLSQFLPGHMVPVHFICLDRLPLTTNGKIDLEQLPLPGTNERELEQVYENPIGEIEQTLAQIWSDVLEIEPFKIGRTANFFLLGGDSLNAAIMLSRAAKAFHVKVPLAKAFQYRTLMRLSQVIEQSVPALGDHVRLVKNVFVPVEERDYYPLSPAQERIYFLERMQGRGTAFNISIALQVWGNWNESKFQTAFQRLVQRYEILRTFFTEVDNIPVQRVCFSDDVVVKVEKLEGDYHDFIQPFDLSCAPLLRAGMKKKPDGSHILILDLHHIAGDGTTIGVLLDELLVLYNGGELDDPVFHYKDFVFFQDRMLREGHIDRQMQYWQTVFPSNRPVPVLNFPTDFSRPPVFTFAGGSYHYYLSVEKNERIKKICRENDVTLFMYLLTGVTILLNYITGNNRMITGCGVSGRTRAELQRIPGMFVNALPIYTRIDPCDSINGFLESVKKNCLQVFENQDVPFEYLVEKLKPPRDPSRHPFFDISLLVQNFYTPSQMDNRYNVSLLPVNREKVKNDLTIFAYEASNNGLVSHTGISLRFDYCSSLFTSATIERLAVFFSRVLEQMAANPTSFIREIDILSLGEKRQVISHFNSNMDDFPTGKTVVDLFEDQVGKTPLRVAIESGEFEETYREIQRNEVVSSGLKTLFITYRDLNERADELAHRLMHMGVTPGSIVAIIQDRSILLAISIMGILKSGAAYLPIDPVLPQERIDLMLEDSNPGFTLESKRGEDRNASIKIFPTGYGRQQKRGQARKISPMNRSMNRLTSHSPAYVIYTSGSTGLPKGVIINHKGLFNTINWQKREYNLNRDDRCLQIFSPGFDAFVPVFFTPLVSGARVVMVREKEKKDINTLKSVIIKRYITRFISVPSLYETLLSVCGEMDLKLLRTVTLGGEPCPPSLAIKSLKRYPSIELINEYGPTETTVTATCRRHLQLNRSITIGTPIANTCIYILLPNRRPAPVGIPGEIHISGPGIGNGYQNDPEQTKKKFFYYEVYEGQEEKRYVYKSGDMGRWLENGEIDFLGRLDRQVKVNGNRVELGEVESALARCTGVKEAAVIAHGGAVYGYAVLKSGTIDDVKERLMEILPSYAIPGRLILLDVLPRTGYGKVDTEALPALADSVVEKFGENPMGRIEKSIAGIFEELLNLEHGSVKRGDDFFMCGGHSLKATLLVAQIKDKLNVKLKLETVFRLSTVQDLARVIGKVTENARFYDSLKPAEKRDFYPLSPAQKRIFFLSRLNHVGTAYNMPHLFMVKGHLDLGCLEWAFCKLIERHAPLRTSFHLAGEEPVQRVHDQVGFGIKIFSTVLDRDRWRRESIYSFELSRAPLFRVFASSVGKSGFLFLFDMHHIIGDGMSMAVLVNDVLGFYGGEPGEVLPPLRIQYHDFSVWQTHELERGSFLTNERYWLERFNHGQGIPVLDFPMDFNRPPVFDFKGNEFIWMIPARETDGLYRMAEQSGTTLFMVLLAVFGMLLSRYTGQDDIIIGSGSMGRGHAALVELIGMFVNTLALRLEPSPEKSFGVFLRETKTAIIEGLEHQDYPFEDLVEKLNLNRDPSRNPLFDVMLLVQNVEKVKRMYNKIEIEPVESEKTHAKFDLGIYAVESPDLASDEIQLRFEYASSLFKAKTIQAFARHFLYVLREIIREPGQLLGGIDYISDKEKEKILFDYNGSAFAKPVIDTLHELFERQVAVKPDRIATVGSCLHDRYMDRVHVSYGDINAQANRIARFLLDQDKKYERGLGPVVGIWLERSVEQVAAILGVLKAGAAYLPINPGMPIERVRRVIEDSVLRVMVSQERFSRDLEILHWQCSGFSSFLTIDSKDTEETVCQYFEKELIDRQLWDLTVQKAADDIEAGGWINSFTGQPFSRLEMEEYGENVKGKLEFFLFHDVDVLEIGCSSGLTMFKIAPLVKEYWGTDISPSILEYNMNRIRENNYTNIRQLCIGAIDIDKLQKKDFQVVIINSVVQCFPDYDYLRGVIRKAVRLMAETGVIFIGDVMDLDLKPLLIEELERFAVFRSRETAQRDAGREVSNDTVYKTKVDVSNELFVSRGFWENLVTEIHGLERVSFGTKMGTVENELTRYRYDVLFTVNRLESVPAADREDLKKKSRFNYKTLLNYSSINPGFIVSPDQWAYVIYTSGTSGRPKGTAVSHLSVCSLVADRNHCTSVSFRDRVIHPLNIAFDASVYNCFAPLVNGGVMVLPSELHVKDVRQLAHIIKQENITIYAGVASMFNAIVDLYPAAFDMVEKVMMGGERPSLTHVKKALTRYGPNRLINIYGPTEATVFCTAYEINELPETQTGIPIGKPVTNAEIYILDPGMQLVPVGVAGEIVMGGTCVSDGYLNRIELTADYFLDTDFYKPKTQTSTTSTIGLLKQRKKASSIDKKEMPSIKSLAPSNKNFAGGPGGSFFKSAPPGRRSQSLYKSGDRGRWLDSGDIEFLGRMDWQVKVRGYRIELEEVESCLKGMVGIRDAVVEAVRDGNGDLVLCGYVVGKEGAVLDIEMLKEGLGRIIPSFMVPSYFLELERMPLTENGKIDRGQLPSPIGEREKVEVTIPVGYIQEVLAEIWGDVLGVDQKRIDMDDHFFKIGGHSLRATVMVAIVQKKLGVQIPLADVFNAPTIRELSRIVEELLGIGDSLGVESYGGVTATEDRDYYPVTGTQRRLFFLWQLERDNTGYNETAAAWLDGCSDVGRLQELLYVMGKRHESLRTSFFLHKGEPVQRVHREAEIVIDWVESDGREPAVAVREFVRPFDLTRLPLFRFGVLSFGDSGDRGKHLLVMDAHHIIIDGTSMGLLVMECMNLLADGMVSEYDNRRKLQYKDFAVWQSRFGERIKLEQEGYWLDRFEGEVPVLDLPYDFPRPNVQSFDGHRINLELTESITDRVKGFAAERNVTAFMVFLGVYAILLARLSGDEDIVVGIPVAGRRYAEIQPIVGMLVNTLALRNQPSDNKTFAYFLTEVKRDTLEAFENRDYPFEELVEQIGVGRDWHRNPLFSAALGFHNLTPGIADSMAVVEKSGLMLRPFQLDKGPSKFDLTVHVNETAGVFQLRFEYCTRLFKEFTVRRWGRYFVNILESVLKKPGRKVREIDFIGEQEKKFLLFAFNETQATYPTGQSLNRLFEDTVERVPDRVALEQGSCILTYSELDRIAGKVAWELNENGGGPGVIVALKVRRSLEMVIGILGILKTGGIYLPIDPDFPEKRIRYMLAHSGTGIVLEEIDNRLSIVERRFPTRGETTGGYVIYTSGSGGRSKGVLTGHEGVVNLVYFHRHMFEVTEMSRFSQVAGVSFDAVVLEMWPCLASGAVLVFAPRTICPVPDIMKEWLIRHHITVSFQPTAVAQELTDLPWSRSSNALRFLLTGGDRLIGCPQCQLPFRYFNLYGVTEDSVYSTCYELTVQENINGPPPIGKPIANKKVFILNRSLMLQPIGVPGVIYLAGPGIARGYLNEPELTKTFFLKNLLVSSHLVYKTGDQGRWRDDGNLEFLGRLDRQVSIRGFRVEMGEIEGCLSGHAGVKGAVVKEWKGRDGRYYLCAYVVFNDEPVELKSYLMNYLPVYMIPLFFIQLDRIPLTAHNKIDYKALQEPAMGNKTRYTAPHSVVELRLVEIFSRVLGLSIGEIGIDWDFFDLGGHSLRATAVVSEAFKEFGADVPLELFFKHPTVRELAALIKRMPKSEYSGLEKAEAREHFPLTPGQRRYFILWKLLPQSIAYHMPLTVQLNSGVDIRNLEKVFKKLIQRHESLRTSFHVIDGQMVQRIHENVAITVEVVDSYNLFTDFVRPFDLEKAPLVRVGMVKKETRISFLLIDIHHIIADGKSVQVLRREFLSLLRKNDETELEPLAFQFTDFSQWLIRQLENGNMESHRAFWLEKLGGDLPVLKLPTDFPRPVLYEPSGARYTLSAGNNLAGQVSDLLKRTGTTLYMAILAVYSILLSRWTGQDDMIIGSPIARRFHADLDNIVGPVMGFVMMRIAPEREISFAAFLSTVKKTALDAYKHQEFPFEELLKELDWKELPGREAITGVSLTVQNIFDTRELMLTEQLNDREIGAHIPGTSKLDLNLEVVEVEDDIRFTFEYATSLFRPTTIELLARCFLMLLNEAVNKPEALIENLDMDDEVRKNGDGKK